MGTALSDKRIVRLAHRHQRKKPNSIHPSAVISPTARLGSNVCIMASVVVDEGACIGDGVTIYPHVYVGRDCVVGDGTILYPNVTLREAVKVGRRCRIHSGSVIGSDGFGFIPVANGRRLKIPHVGTVELGDDVVVGANAAIDRGTLEKTRVGSGVVIDAQVQVGHNASIGDRTHIGTMSGICGSTRIGRDVRLGHDVAVVPQIEIGDGASAEDCSSITKNLPAGAHVGGMPALPTEEARRLRELECSLPELFERLRALERKLADKP
ncbi:UDP-3-O-(3-hydroxymyristoyl)glucosamine N-acyltransferase [bacterium]|nr:UDP-3-O-(3-hydroxymyristoyl)glucosamine N-acyltransferase [bacterium]